LRDLPADRRRDIAGHIAEARAELPAESEAEIRTLLDRIGPPSVIAADERLRLGPKRPAHTREVVAIVLLLAGGSLFLVGWLVGVALLWASDAWSVRDKLIGTLIVPGGLSGAFIIIGVVAVDVGGSESFLWILMVVLLVAPILAAVYLGLRLRGRPAAA